MGPNPVCGHGSACGNSRLLEPPHLDRSDIELNYLRAERLTAPASERKMATQKTISFPKLFAQVEVSILNTPDAETISLTSGFPLSISSSRRQRTTKIAGRPVRQLTEVLFWLPSVLQSRSCPNTMSLPDLDRLTLIVETALAAQSFFFAAALHDPTQRSFTISSNHLC
jgi:hypothetical protein